MATGYTEILSGYDVTFEAFALRCARAMGACVTLREEALDVPIPAKLVPSTYHADRAEEARTALRALEALTIEQCDARAIAEHEAEVRHYGEMVARVSSLKGRYARMRDMVSAWAPPTPEHEGLRTFMIQQLDESIRSCFDPTPPTPVKTGAEWRAERAARHRDNIAYHAREHANEVARTDSRNEWLDLLRASLKEG